MTLATGNDAIETGFVQDYKGNVAFLAQQMGARLPGLVTQDDYVGKQGAPVEQYDAGVAEKQTTRNQQAPDNDLAQDRRWVYPSDYIWGKKIDTRDKLRMITDPTSPTAIAATQAILRAKDDEIIDAFFATANTGETGSSSESFDTTNYRVAVNTGGTASSLNVAKLQNAILMLMGKFKGEITEPVFAGISEYEHDALLKEIQVTSRDFNGGDPVLVDGRVKRFMGINFVLTSRLNITSGNRLIPVWVPTGMHLGTWEDIGVDISPRKDLARVPWQVQTWTTIGATRLEQGKVVQILCDDQI